MMSLDFTKDRINIAHKSVSSQAARDIFMTLLKASDYIVGYIIFAAVAIIMSKLIAWNWEQNDFTFKLIALAAIWFLYSIYYALNSDKDSQ